MAGKLRNFTVFGAFKRKSDAVRRERRTKGSFIERKSIAHRLRYIVLKPKGR